MADVFLMAAQLLASSMTDAGSQPVAQPDGAAAVAVAAKSPKGQALRMTSRSLSRAALPVPTATPPNPFSRPSACEESVPGPGCESVPGSDGAQDSGNWAGAAEEVDIRQTTPARTAGRPQPLMPMLPRFSQPTSAHPAVAVSETHRWVPRPQNGSQLYAQRLAALQSGQLFTRISPAAFQARWEAATEQPTHQQWQALLAQEARAVTAGQGHNRLTVVVGDSLSLWLPSEALPRNRFWLNQSISGETTGQILNRLSMFSATRPDTIYVMAGVNDLKNGASNAEVVNNLQLITQRLRQQHPEARIVVHSILPTRLANVPSTRVRLLNQLIGYAVRQQGGEFLDLQPQFMDAQGDLSQELTTDGLHLNPQGYRVWQMSMLAI